MEIIWHERNGCRSIESYNEGEYHISWKHGVLKKGVEGRFVIENQGHVILKVTRIN